MLTFVANECRTLRRRRQRRREDPIAAAAAGRPSGALTPEEDVIEHDLARAAREVLASLPPGDRETIVAALADRSGEPPRGAAFRKRLERARRRLREAWSEACAPRARARAAAPSWRRPACWWRWSGCPPAASRVWPGGSGC
jgi:hypothetical protein